MITHMSLSTYLKETKGELKHVSWPTRTQATLFTVLVIVVSILMALYLGAFDLLYTTLFKKALSVHPISTTASTTTPPFTVSVATGTPITIPK